MKQTLLPLQTRLLEALTSLLVCDQKYDIVINTHKDTQTFISIKKALVKDINKLVENKGEWPICYIVEFSDVKIILDLTAMKSFKVIPKGIVLQYATYEVSFASSK